VVVTHDLLGISQTRPPRFVPVLAHLGDTTRAALREYVSAVEARRYPASEHVYPMKPSPRASDEG
jgi:3-methyl-2-oxobutanoate hydroxymethyltransferase